MLFVDYSVHSAALDESCVGVLREGDVRCVKEKKFMIIHSSQTNVASKLLLFHPISVYHWPVHKEATPLSIHI